jgi:hypothetical protein
MLHHRELPVLPCGFLADPVLRICRVIRYLHGTQQNRKPSGYKSADDEWWGLRWIATLCRSVSVPCLFRPISGSLSASIRLRTSLRIFSVSVPASLPFKVPLILSIVIVSCTEPLPNSRVRIKSERGMSGWSIKLDTSIPAPASHHALPAPGCVDFRRIRGVRTG